MKIVEIIVLIIASIITVSWSYGVRKLASSGSGITRQTVNTTMLFVCSTVLTLIFGWSSFNLFWMFPLSWVLGIFSLSFPFSLLWIPGQYFAQICVIGINNENIKIQKEINKLEKEVKLENNKIGELLKKYGDNTEALKDLPEFTDPKKVIPRVCKGQTVVYLRSKILGKSDVDSFHDVLWSRYNNNPTKILNIKASDFNEVINTRGFTLSGLCKEIIRRENPDQGPAQLNYLNSLVDKYFQTDGLIISSIHDN